MPSKKLRTRMWDGSLPNTSAIALVPPTWPLRMVSQRDSQKRANQRVVLDDSNPSHIEVLNKIKTRFREETFTRQSIQETIQSYPELIRMLYINFAMVHCEYYQHPPS